MALVPVGRLLRRGARPVTPDWLPTPWRVEEDWTAEITAADGTTVCKVPLQNLPEARAIVAAVNAALADREGASKCG